ncbi:MAG: hypothetical protein AAF985_11335 [Bacteroidota bacterium]
MSQDFEKYARKTFHQQEMEVDTEALWDAVYPEVRENKKRRFWLWFFMIGSSITLLGLLGIYSHLAMSHDTPIAIPAEPTEPIAPAKNNTLTIDENQTGTIDPSLKEEDHLVTTTNYPEILEASTQIKQSIHSSPTVGPKKEKVYPATTSSSISPNNTSQPVAQPNGEQGTGLQAIAPTKTTKNITILLLDSKSAFPLMPAERPMDSLDFVSVDDWAPFASPKQSKWGFGAYAGLGYANRKLTRPGRQTLVRYRQSVERELETLQLGLSIYYETHEHFYLRSGIEYSRMASCIHVDTVDVFGDTIANGIQSISINTITGDTTFNRGTIYNTRSIATVRTDYNYFHLIDIPLMVGYKVNLRKWTVGLEAGVLFNLLLKSQGILPVSFGQLYSISSDRAEWYRNHLGITPMVSGHFSYRLAPNRQIYLAPFYRFPKVFSTSAHPLTERLSLLGLQTGIRFNF